MRIFERLEELESLIGQEIGVSDWIAVEQPRIQAFADATEDQQWIHTDPARAVAGPFGATIAHGFLTLSLLPRFYQTAFRVEEVRMGLNYGLDRVRFPAPVPVGSKLRGRFVLRKLEAIDGGVQMMVEVTVEREGGSKPVCVAESLTRQMR
ncbi:MAG: MaoC family dehydratase [Mitsuaria chitosanitabida]|uniref:MaoC family dehydratase n=1 Tax=Roseateles chitosanitabidus TaxID=65048 RepID=UPI001B2962EB|nr:MaoC family dehydratase [Roseateles chitosanitabidus]MBO9688466.1 MaoC family dehydratase [Roseateles chitosanitabidus]